MIANTFSRTVVLVNKHDKEVTKITLLVLNLNNLNLFIIIIIVIISQSSARVNGYSCLYSLREQLFGTRLAEHVYFYPRELY